MCGCFSAQDPFCDSSLVVNFRVNLVFSAALVYAPVVRNLVDLIFLSRVMISSLVSPLHKPIIHDFLSRSLSLCAFCCSLSQVPRSPSDGCFLCLYFFATDYIAPSPVTFRVCSVRAVLRASNLRCSPLFYCESSSFPGSILAGRRPPPLLRLPLVSQPAGRVCTALHSVFPVSGLSGRSGVHCRPFKTVFQSDFCYRSYTWSC
jgi:hypothetical protein